MPTRFRPDIEGLRAVAVVLVVLDHLTGRPSGGFIGVDVFFAISGFLITGLLLEETERRGRLSFRGFYARRARRILPAALTVLGAVLIAAHLVFRGARISQTSSDVRWALGFAANIHFQRLGTDYFQANRAPSLVQHFWSLAVEEQFYLVWPLVIVLAMTVLGHFTSRRVGRLVLLAAIGTGTLASFGYALNQSVSDPNGAYFSTFTRAWELGAGALLAVAVRTLPGRFGLDARLAGPVSVLALGGIVLGAFVVPSGSGFPAPWAALPVISACVLLGVGGSAGRWTLALTNPISRYLGRISYSLYLWHWPVIVIVATLVPRTPGLKYPIAIFAMLGLSVGSYHFVESPLRRLRLPVRRTVGRPDRRTARPRRWGSRVRPAVASTLCLLIVLTLSILVPPRKPPATLQAAVSAPVGLARSGPQVAQPRPALSTAIEAALSATGFPDLTPGLDQLDSARAHWGACDGARQISLTRCTFGDQKPNAKIAVVIGDSTAMSWLPGIQAALPADQWRLYGLTLEACPAANIPVYDTNRHYDKDCDAQHAWAAQEVQRLAPQLVILASTEDTLSRLGDGATGAKADSEYRTALQATIEQLHPSNSRHVLTLAPPPMTEDLTRCDTVGAIPADCVRRITAQWVAFAAAERAVAAATGTAYSDTHLWFCSDTGDCPAFIGNTSVRWDGQHLTDVYARSLADDLRSVITTALRH